ncbi:MAG: response regulator transcription factor [Flavobacteriales bacterium]|nr:response regulator transcription factor [Flavobacteriales bacterium]
MIEIIIADSNHLIRSGLNAILKQYDDFRVLGEASNADQLEEMIVAFKPSIVLIDFASKGFEVNDIPRCIKKYSLVKFVAITGEQSGNTIVHALRAGITSYIKKDCDVNEIVDSVRETYNGGRFFCGQILDAIRKESIDVEDLNIVEMNCEPVNISEREMEVIKLIAQGYTNQEIADKLFLSHHTVNTHRKNIMSKLGVNNTAAIVMYAVKTELVSPNHFLFSAVNS